MKVKMIIIIIFLTPSAEPVQHLHLVTNSYAD